LEVPPFLGGEAVQEYGVHLGGHRERVVDPAATATADCSMH
jgi:hypothetical protein